MRILYVSPHPPARDGIGDSTAALASAIVAEGHEVRVVTPRALPGPPAEVIGALGATARGRAALRARIAAYAPDIVHVQLAVAAFGSRTPALLGLLRELRSGAGRPRVVITAHEVTRDTATLRAPGRALYRRLAALADRVLVHTDAARRQLTDVVGVAPAAVAVVPLHRLPPAQPTTDPAALRSRHGLGDARVLLAFGFVHVDKGLDDLVAALGRLRAQDRQALDDVRLVVAGAVRRRSGAFRAFEARDRLHLARVRGMVVRAGLARHVRFVGYVPEGEVSAWFDLAAAAVLPYRRIEQSGVGSLAAARGTPVLASAIGRLVDDFGDPRWSFPPRDPARLAGAIRAFLDDRGPPPPGPAAVVGDLAGVVAATLRHYGAPPAATPPRSRAHA